MDSTLGPAESVIVAANVASLLIKTNPSLDIAGIKFEGFPDEVLPGDELLALAFLRRTIAAVNFVSSVQDEVRVQQSSDDIAPSHGAPVPQADR